MRKILFASVAVLALSGCGTINNLTGRGDSAQPVSMDDTRSVSQLAASEFMDMNVIDRNGKEIGEVSDVLVNRQGQPQRIVMQQGGILGIGGKNVALDVDNLRHSPSRQALVATNVTAETADTLPEFNAEQSNLVSLSKQQQK